MRRAARPLLYVGVLVVVFGLALVHARVLNDYSFTGTSRFGWTITYVGVLCVEYFVVDDGRGGLDLVVNEIAPRPHNSGHYTQNACDVSQFEAQVRALAGLPLRTPVQHSPALMVNLLGDLWFAPNAQRALRSDTAVSPPWDALLALPGTHLHLYGKTHARPGRKMGHLNITGPSVAAVRDTAAKALALLGLPPLAQ